MKRTLSLIYRNLIGWSTNRKIIVLESDDWGSVRIRSKEDSDAMLKKGVPLASNHFTQYDALESNDDLESLFDLLTHHKDASGRPPVFTPMCTMVNPVFDQIEKSDFDKYIYEPFTDTCKRYNNHNRVCDLWLQGVENRLFVPQFHGREHINPLRWLRQLKGGNKDLLNMFAHGSYGILETSKGEVIPNYLAAFDAEVESDCNFILDSIDEGLALFKDKVGYPATCFVPCSGTGISQMEQQLKKNGIKYVNSGRVDKIPNGKGGYKTRVSWLGKKNDLGQRYITRNVFFEPSAPISSDWIDSALYEIDMAFKFKKPAIVSVHRVNFIGYIDEQNQSNGLKCLDGLLTKIMERWPDAEFLTTEELGSLMSNI